MENFTKFFGSASAPLDPSADFPVTLTVPKFDSNLGTLLSVDLVLTATVNGEVDIYNLTTQTQAFTNSFVSTLVSVTGPDGSSVTEMPFAYVTSGNANAGRFVETIFTPDNSPGNGTGSSSVLAIDPGMFESPGGTGLVDLDVDSNGSETVGGSAVKANTLAFSGIVNVYGSVEVVYDYATPVPEPPLYAAFLGAMALGIAVLGHRKPRREKLQA
jgi:hypothetical protein